MSPPSEQSDLRRVLRQLRRMPSEQLEIVHASDDNFMLDCLLEKSAMIDRLQKEKDSLQAHVADMANFNYAREPEFVRDRTRLRKTLEEVNELKRRVTSIYVVPILDKLSNAEHRIMAQARQYSEQSDDILEKFNHSQLACDEFVDKYVASHKEHIKRRTIADRLNRERQRLAACSDYRPANHRRQDRNLDDIITHDDNDGI